MEKALIVNIEKLKNDSYLDKNVSNNDVRIAAEHIQHTVIEHIIGTCLFDCLKRMIVECEIDKPCNSLYKCLLDEFLFPIFTYAVMAELSVPKSIKVRNIGTIQQQSENVTQVGLSDIKYLNHYYKNKADFYMQRAIKYLKCNKDCFPELCSCECSWCADKSFSKQPTTPFNLKCINVHRKI